MATKAIITKRELFDEDVMKPLLNDIRFNKADRTRLSNYNKHRTSGSQLTVAYRYGLGCEELQLGRLYPVDGIGLQSFRHDIRNPLTQKHYWDVDMENAHYYIAREMCIRNNVSYQNIDTYIRNREHWLNIACDSRKKAKTEFLKTLYGGCITLYNESFDDVDGTINADGLTLLKGIESEITTLSNLLWAQNPLLHKLRTGKEKKPLTTRPNPKASLMSLLIQTEERKCLLALDAFLTTNKRFMGVLIHDGGLVEKLEKETEFPVELLRECEKALAQQTGYPLVLAVKPIKHDWIQYKPQETQYDIMKREFEKTHFFVGSLIVCIHSDGYVERKRFHDASITYQNMYVDVYDDKKNETVKVSFFDKWCKDEKRMTYERIDFRPDVKSCPDSIYNLFSGFEAEKLRPETLLPDDDMNALIKPILEHIDIVTSGNRDYFLRWHANIIQDPAMKSEVSILLRDMGSLLTEGGGSGKNILEEWFGRCILGEKYFLLIGDNREMYNQFNSLQEGKLLCFIEEANGKDNFSFTDLMKAKTTSSKININRKGQAQYESNDYCRHLSATNYRNAFNSGLSNRRMCVFDANPIKRGDETYFTQLKEAMDKPDVQWAFYQYLLTMDTYKKPIQFQNAIPITNAYLDMRLLNAPLHLKWIVFKLRNGTLKDGSINDLYKEFANWVADNREGKTDALMSLTAFGLALNNSTANNEYSLSSIGEKKRTKKHNIMHWNYKELIQGLKKILLLEETFEYNVNVVNNDDVDYEEVIIGGIKYAKRIENNVNVVNNVLYDENDVEYEEVIVGGIKYAKRIEK
jgi:hypothetical protein